MNVFILVCYYVVLSCLFSIGTVCYTVFYFITFQKCACKNASYFLFFHIENLMMRLLCVCVVLCRVCVLCWVVVLLYCVVVL